MFQASLCPSSGGQTEFHCLWFSVLQKEIRIKCCVVYLLCVCMCSVSSLSGSELVIGTVWGGGIVVPGMGRFGGCVVVGVGLFRGAGP